MSPLTRIRCLFGRHELKNWCKVVTVKVGDGPARDYWLNECVHCGRRFCADLGPSIILNPELDNGGG